MLRVSRDNTANHRSEYMKNLLRASLTISEMHSMYNMKVSTRLAGAFPLPHDFSWLCTVPDPEPLIPEPLALGNSTSPFLPLLPTRTWKEKFLAPKMVPGM